MTPRNLSLLVASLTILLATSTLAAHADFTWTTEDENTSLAGYQWTLPTPQGTEVSFALSRNGYCLAATAAGTYKRVPNGLNIRYEFAPDANIGDVLWLDIYADVTDHNPPQPADQIPVAVDLTGESYLNFHVRGDIDGQVMRVELVDENWNETNKLLVGDYCGRGNGIETGDWHIVSIPFADFGSTPDYSTITIVSFTIAGDEADKGDFHSLFVDEISFTGSPLAARWPRDEE